VPHPSLVLQRVGSVRRHRQNSCSDFVNFSPIIFTSSHSRLPLIPDRGHPDRLLFLNLATAVDVSVNFRSKISPAVCQVGGR